MIEKQKKTGLAIMIAGIIIIVIAIIGGAESFKTGLLSGLGTALFVTGAARILKMFRLGKNPEKAAEYEAQFTDERTVYISGKAGKLAMFIAVYTELAAGLVAIFAFDSEIICMLMCYAACFQCLVYFVVFVIINKKC